MVQGDNHGVVSLSTELINGIRATTDMYGDVIFPGVFMFTAQPSECDENRAVSPVIGIILMVAITVILAAVIGTFAFGLFDRDTNPAPSVVFETEYDDSAGELTIIHESGSSFESANVEFKISGGDGSATVSNSWPTEVNSGNSVTLTNVGADEMVQVVWQDPREQDTSSVLFDWSGPEA